MFSHARVRFAALVVALALSGCATHSGVAHPKNQVAPDAKQQSFDAVARGGRVKAPCRFPLVKLCLSQTGRDRCSCVSEWRMREILDPWND